VNNRKTQAGDLPKRLVRDLQKKRGCAYSSALRELRQLAVDFPGIDLRAYVNKIESKEETQ
jgi:hypothetical protein